jgi:hypothetical protein
MDKLPRYVIWIIFIVVTLIVVGIFTYNAYIPSNNQNSNDNTSNEKISDAKTFKNEYEEMNGKKVNDVELINITIKESNPIYYASLSDLKKIKNGVILIGKKDNQNTRNLIPTLFSVAESRGLNTIYYLETTDNNKKEINSLFNIEVKDTDLLIIKNSKLIYQNKGLGIKIDDENKALSDSNKEELAKLLGKHIDEINPGVCDEAC